MSPRPSPSAAPPRADLQAVTLPGPVRSRWPLAVIIAVLVVALGAAGYYLRFAPKAQSAFASVKTVKAVRGPLQRTLRVTGSGGSRNFSNIVVPLAQAPETRELVLISLPPNGSPVKEGEVIAQLETQAVKDHLDDVEAMVRQTELDLKRLRAYQQSRREAMEQSIRAAKANWDRAKEDMKSASVKSEIDREKLKLLLEES